MVAIVNYGIAQGWGSAAFVGIASGVNFPDALVGGPVCGANRGVLLLTDPRVLSPQTGDWITAQKTQIVTIVYFGHVAAISQSVIDAIAACSRRAREASPLNPQRFLARRW